MDLKTRGLPPSFNRGRHPEPLILISNLARNVAGDFRLGFHSAVEEIYLDPKIKWPEKYIDKWSALTGVWAKWPIVSPLENERVTM